MQSARWVLALGLALAPGLVVEIGCVAARAAGPPRVSQAGSPHAQARAEILAAALAPDDDADPPDDPCADPDALDGLDDPCYVDVPPEEVQRALAGRGPVP